MHRPEYGWDESNPAMGHCDVSSFVAWEHLGGDLVLGEVHLDSEFREYHYWNRIGDTDLDLTLSQFKRGEVITELRALESEFLAGNQAAMKPEVKARIDTFRRLVKATAACPLRTVFGPFVGRPGLV